MSQHDATFESGGGRGNLIGWVIGLVIIVAGMAVAGALLDGGQVWVVPETQSYVATGGTVDAPTGWVTSASEAGQAAASSGSVVAEASWQSVTQLPAGIAEADRPADAVFSVNRTIGVWLAAILTLFIMSFLIGDNPFYKTAEAIVVGSSAAYWMVYSFYTCLLYTSPSPRD